MSIIIKDTDEITLIDEIEKYLIKFREVNKKDIKLYFSGECDGNQTDFERSSNNLELGVIAPNKLEALVLLLLLRIIIDDNDDLLINNIADRLFDEDRSIDNPIKIMEIVKILSESEENYLNSFNINDDITTTLRSFKGDYKVTKNLYEIDIYTLPRIMREIKLYYKKC